MKTADIVFLNLLGGFSLIDIEHYSDAVFGLYDDLTFGYFNPAWYAFAAENAGEPQISRNWGLGRSIMDAIPPDLTKFYTHLYTKALATGTASEHVYECSSPARRRHYHQIAYPFSGKALLVVNSLVISMPVENSSDTGSYIDENYRDAEGNLYQCAHCRKTRNLKHESRWDLIPYFIRYSPPRTRHCLCNACREYYYYLDGLPSR